MVLVTCPYCDGPAVLVDSAEVYGRSYGKMWLCRPCKAYVGVHKGTDKPLGTLANAELREWRKRAHAAFDLLWKSRRMSRGKAYRKLMQIVGVCHENAHIGMFNIEQCKKLIEGLEDLP